MRVPTHLFGTQSINEAIILMRCRGGWLHKIVNSSPGLQHLLQPAHLSPGASSWGILHPDYLKTDRKT